MSADFSCCIRKAVSLLWTEKHMAVYFQEYFVQCRVADAEVLHESSSIDKYAVYITNVIENHKRK